ncbi:MAG: hypothetical protein EOM80_05395 [Erysipelotrichia bacterium]|nr:hypothetical protein [Erysipelotrichia bacterium]
MAPLTHKTELCKKTRTGMALVLVLAISTVLLILGVSYLKTFSNSTQVGKLQLDQVQSEFFARGIQNIALFKIKRYPDFFLRSYRYHVYQARVNAGDDTVPAPIAAFPNPAPFAKFVGIYPGNTRDLLQHIPDADNTEWGFTEPLRIATYSTSFSLRSADDFKRGFIEITVYLQLDGRNLINKYQISIDASQTARI